MRETGSRTSAAERIAGIPARIILLLALGLAACLWPVSLEAGGGKQAKQEKPAATATNGCLTCHTGIESMHANLEIACVDCHGGNAKATTMEAAHVQPRKGSIFAKEARPVNSYSFLNLESPEFIRFYNPGDLRVADKSCGSCHGDIVDSVRKSIMATNAMVHNAVFYNNGGIASKIPIYGECFTVTSQPCELVPNPPPTQEARNRGALLELHPHPNFDVTKIGDPLRVAEVNNPELGNRGPGTGGRIEAVYLNVLKTRLNDPTLWFLGTNEIGGDYRDSGCSACHVIYANSRDAASGEYAKYGNLGVSQSADKAIHGKAGFPIIHQFTNVIPAMQCLTCHYHQGNGAIDTYIGAIWWDRESDAEKVKELKADPDYGPGESALWTHNAEFKNVQFEDYHAHGWNFMKVYKRDDKGRLLDKSGNIIADNDPDKFKKAVHLEDIHFEKGMDCIDCHTEQDMHGDGNMYAQMDDAIEIRCQDCHGTIRHRATLLTSGEGKSGGHDLKQVTTPFGDPQFEVAKDGKIIEHSMTRPGVSWVVKQVVDTINPASPDYDPKSAYAKLVLVDGRMGSPNSANGALAHGGSKIECFTCHSAWQTTCSGCHLPLDLNVKSRDLHYDPKFSRGYAPYNLQVIRTDLYFFGIGSYNHGYKVTPFRPASATIVSAWDGERQDVVHEQPLVSTPGFANDAMTPHPPHTVRAKDTKQCTDCHLSAANNNNARIASALGFGINAMNFVGTYAYIAEKGKAVTAVRVTEGLEPMPVIGSSFDRILYPESYARFIKDKRILKTAYRRDAPKVRCVTTRGEYLISAEGSAGFKLYDIANIDNKGVAERIVQHVNSPAGEGTVIHSPDATFVYFPSSLPMELGRVVLPENHEQPIHELYRYALATDAKDGLILINVNTLTDADPENNYLRKDVVFNPNGMLRGAMMVKTWGHYAYVVSDQTGLSVVDLNIPTRPRLVYQSPPGQLDGARAVEMQLRYAFVLDRGGMKIFDITNPEQPVLLPNATVAMADARNLTLFRTYALVAAGKQGLAIIDITNPERPGTPVFYNAGGVLNDAYDVTVGATNVSFFAYVADGKNGLRIVSLVEPTDNPTYEGFSPDLMPKLIATFPTKGRAVSVAPGQIRDRYVDESGDQIAVTSRMGSRPFNAAEIRRMLFYPNGQLMKLSNQPPAELVKRKAAQTVAQRR